MTLSTAAGCAEGEGMSANDRPCGFCRKSRAEVFRMVVGADASICDVCLQLAVDVHFDAVRRPPAPAGPTAPDLDTQIALLPGLSVLDKHLIGRHWLPPTGGKPTLRDLTQATRRDLLRIPGIGPHSLAEIEAWLAGMGLSLLGET